jgi:hypothetical protein
VGNTVSKVLAASILRVEESIWKEEIFTKNVAKEMDHVEKDWPVESGMAEWVLELRT